MEIFPNVSYCDFGHLELQVPNPSNNEYTGNHPGRVLMQNEYTQNVYVMSAWSHHPSCEMDIDEFLQYANNFIKWESS
jgi:hypothetical protein